MKKNPSIKTLQSQNRSDLVQTTSHWRRVGAAALVLCLLAGTPVAHAQDPASNQATLNFVGADIESVIKAIGHYTRTTFIIDPRVKGTINLVSENPVTKAQALDMLASALRLQGYAIVRTDGTVKVVPEADAKLQAGPTQTTATVRGDQIATQIFRLNYEQAVNLVPVLRPLISPNNTINANPGNNTIIVTDYADNLKRMGKIIASLDTPATTDLDVVPIRHAIASDIAVMVNRLLDQGVVAVPGAPVSGGGVSVLADTRTNSVIVRASSATRANLAKSLIAKLDQPTQQPGNVHVIYLRNAEAVRLAQTLRAVVASDASAQSSAAATPQQPPQQQAQQTSLTSGQQQTGLGSGQLPQSTLPPALPTGGAGGFIQADPATNSLIITASETVYRNLRSVIDQLDARRAQVYIETLIVEVSSDQAVEFGVQWAGLTGDSTSAYRVGTLTGFSSGGNNLINLAASRLATGTSTATAPPTPGNGLNLGIFRQINGQLTLGAIAHALASAGNTNILSMPNVITLDNDEAKILVGQNVPFVTGQFTTAASAGAAGVNPFQTIERRDIGLTLRVKPQVSEGGSVKMAIYQESSTIAPTAGASDIVTNKRSFETNVLVDDGQIIVLGGLIDDTVNDTTEKVPGLGDIPVLGNLFKYQKQGRVKRNLMVFLRPTVVRTNEQSVNLASDRYSYIRNAEFAAQPQPTIVLPNLGAPLLPELKNGRMVDGPLNNLHNLRPGDAPLPSSPQQTQQPSSQPASKQPGLQ